MPEGRDVIAQSTVSDKWNKFLPFHISNLKLYEDGGRTNGNIFSILCNMYYCNFKKRNRYYLRE